jgi:hypothetical protein
MGGFDGGSLIALLIALGILILVFLLVRSIFLWYWKIDTIVENQEKQIELLEDLNKKLGQEAQKEESEHFVMDKPKNPSEPD